MTVASISYHRSGSGEAKMAANSPVEFKSRALGRGGQPVIKRLLANNAGEHAGQNEFPLLKACFHMGTL